MLVALFRQNRPAALFLVPLLVLTLWPGAGGLPTDALRALPAGMPLAAAVHEVLLAHPWTVPALGALLAIGLAVQLALMANASELYDRRNHLPALLFVPIIALFAHGLLPDATLMGMPFVLWALRRVWAAQGHPRILGAMFDSGLLLGIAGLFHLPYVFLVVVVWASLTVMRPPQWREYVVPLIGMAVVFLLAVGITLVLHLPDWDVPGSFLAEQRGAPASFHRHWAYLVLLLTVAACFVVAAAASYAASYSRGVMRDKNTRSSFLAFAFACGLLAAFDRYLEQRLPPVLLAVPLAFFLSWPLLQSRRPTWAELGVLAILGLGLWARWL